MIVTDAMVERVFRYLKTVIIDNDTNIRRFARRSLEAALSSVSVPSDELRAEVHVMEPDAVTELKPCPFCGSNSVSLKYKHEDGTAWVECGHCFAQSGGVQELSMAESSLRDYAAKDWNSRIDASEASLPAKVEGWKLVPIEPTDDMRIAGGEAQQTSIGSWGEPGVVYSAMLAASPALPHSGQGDGDG